MPEREDRILEGLGKLSGLVEASRDDIKTLVGKQDEHAKCLQTLNTSIQVIQTGYENKTAMCGKEFKDINEKLGRDYEVLNILKTKQVVENGVEAYKGKKREWWQYMLGVVGAVIGILIGINQLSGIYNTFTTNTITSSSSAYSTTLSPNRLHMDTTFTNSYDTSKGNR
ncbi:MAG TPA: hypothetical protein VI911_10950 [Patescibacteria group bacterium]|nr:hypothetical protein [Patescibacteria group bacterium]